MNRLSLLKLFAAISLALLTVTPCFGQAVAGAQIHGVVTDVRGAVIPRATITATQTETGIARTTVSGSDGSYALPNLPVGPYRLEIRSPSFSTYVQSGIILQVGENVQVNVALKVGAVTQQVAVSANATMVDTQKTAVSQVIDQRRIVALPLNGRQATDLIMLSGSAATAPSAAGDFLTSHEYPTSVAVSVAGGPGNGNNYLLDGADNRDSHSNVNLPYPFPDALQEFTVETGGLSVRDGLQSGALVNVVTKSGTNQFHGDAFEFVRNGVFDARNFFAPTQDTLRRNQFGATVGGPVKRDKMFFFFGYQGTRERTAPADKIAFVPTAAAISGDFSTLESASCQASHTTRTLTNPATGQPFANNFIDPALFSKPSLALLKYVPVASDPCGKYIYSIPSPDDENQYVTREDWQVNSKLSMFFRYFITDYTNPPYFTNNILTTTRAGLSDRSQSAVLGSQWTLSPTAFNAFHVSFSRLAVTRTVPPGIPDPTELGVNMFSAAPGYLDLSVSNDFGVEGGSNAPAVFRRNQWQLADDTDWIRGRHHVSFGVNWIPVQMDERNVQNADGAFTFNGSLTGDPLADFMLGRESSLTQQSLFEVGLREKYLGLYAGDSIKVTDRLTVNLGLRWEPNLPEHDVAGRGQHFAIAAFEAGQKTSVYKNAPPGLEYYGDSGIPRAYARSSYLDFAPRVGLAWDPSGAGKMSVRADYGIFFDQPESFTAREWGSDSPWGNAVTLAAPAGGFSDPYETYPGGNPFPFPPPNVNSPFPQQGTYINFPLDLHHSYIQKWDLSFEREVGANWLLSASYQGNKGTHFRAGYDANSAQYVAGANLSNTNQRRILYLLNPATGAYFGQILTMDDGVNTNYGAVKLAAEHRFSRNYTLITSYTYSHCLQDAETIANRLDATTYQNPNDRDADYGNCDPDVTHNFVASFVSTSPRFANRTLNLTLGNWQFSTIFSAHTGFPFSPLSGVDASLSGEGRDRPNLLSNPYLRNMDTLQWVNAKAFVVNRPGTFGDAGFNSLRGPGFLDADIGLDRDFSITERQRVQLRFEFFNSLNNVNFNLPVSSLKSASFGKIQGAGDPRILQFSLKYYF